MSHILINPTLVEIKKKNRELLYEWDELKGFLSTENLIVWYKDIQHRDMMTKLGMKFDMDKRYDIVINFKKRIVYVTTWWGKKNFDTTDTKNIKNNDHLSKIIKDFEVKYIYE